VTSAKKGEDPDDRRVRSSRSIDASTEEIGVLCGRDGVVNVAFKDRCRAPTDCDSLVPAFRGDRLDLRQRQVLECLPVKTAELDSVELEVLCKLYDFIEFL
jgi:hypothetical protein